MSPTEQFADVVHVYRAYGEGCARARLVYHGWTVDKPEILEGLLAKVRAYVQHTSLPTQHARQYEQEQAA